MMISRRELMVGAAAGKMAFARASQPKTKVQPRIPKGACDCHTHIFADPSLYPLSPQRSYTPETALPGEMLALQKAIGVDRVVIVTPSVYGTDNRATAFGLRSLGLKRARGVAVIAPDAKDLQELDRQGFRGIRLNFATGSALPDHDAMRARFRTAVAQVQLPGWHIQVYTNLAAIAALEKELGGAAVPVVLDHVCGAIPELGVEQAGFDALLRLVSKGDVYVKLTHRFLSTAPKGPQECGQIIRALVEARPDRMLWGTDWPPPDSSQRRKATEISPLEAIDDGAMLNHFSSFIEDSKVLHRILVENPARLYGF